LRLYVQIWLGWTAAGLFYSTQDYLPRLYRNEPTSLPYTLAGWMVPMYICAAVTPALLWAGRRWPIAQGPRAVNIARHIALSAVFAAVTIGLEAWAFRKLGWIPAISKAGSFANAFWWMLIYGFHGAVIRYWAVIGLQAIYRASQAAREREREALLLQIRSVELNRQLTSSQLRALKAQLHPHFLFNTLEAISSMIRLGAQRPAETMIGRLSSLLRVALDEQEQQEVALWREFEFLRLYLSIEQERFGDRLSVALDCPKGLEEALVPHMILQPLVENAIRHGLGRSEQGVHIAVTARQSGTALELSVTDNGPGNPDGFDHSGIGLANVQERLTRLYDMQAEFHIRNTEPRGAEAVIRLPSHTETAETGAS
jgi:two-component system, LytTR family, sensor kinase